MMFWICGVPGSASKVKVKAPSAMVTGIRCLGMSLWRNSYAANGYTANTTTNSDTPQYVRSAQTSKIESIALSTPTKRLVNDTIALENPERQITLPNTTHSSSTKKYRITNRNIPSLKK